MKSEGSVVNGDRSRVSPGRRIALGLFAAATVLGGMAVAPPTARADIVDPTVYRTGLTSGSSPFQLTAGPDGNVWFTEDQHGAVGRISVADGTITEFSSGVTGSGTEGIVVGPDGNMWFSETSADKIAKITPGSPNTITEFSVTSGSGPYGVAKGPDGNIWYAEYNSGGIGRITPTGTVTDYTGGNLPGSGVLGITAGPDGNLWFTEINSSRVGRITTAGVLTEFSLTGNGPYGIAAGPDGNLWFADCYSSQIGHITPGTTNTVTESSTGVGRYSCPSLISKGPDGNIWVGEANTGSLDRVNITTGNITHYTGGGSVYDVEPGPDGNMWFADYGGYNAPPAIGRLAIAVVNPTLAIQAVSPLTAGSLATAAVTITGSHPIGSIQFHLYGPNNDTCTGAPTFQPSPVPISGNGTYRSDPYRVTLAGRYHWTASYSGDETDHPASTACTDPNGTAVASVDSTVAGVVGRDGQLYIKPNNLAFQSLGGGLLASPAIVSVPAATGPPSPLYIGLGGDRRLYVRSTGAGWQDLLPKQPVGCFDNPAATVTPGSAGGSTLTVACKGGDRALYYWQTPVTATALPAISTPAAGLGGALLSGPALATVNGTLTFFAEGTDNAIYSKVIGGSYTKVPALCTGHPAAAAYGNDAYFACQGLDGALYYSKNTAGGGWSGFRSAGGALLDGPGIATTSLGATIFVEGVDGAMYHTQVGVSGLTATPFTGDGGGLVGGAAAAGIRGV